jgi:ribonuclease P protein component
MRGDGDAVNLAIVVSGKVGPSVVRNKMKRRLREIFKTKVFSDAKPGFYLFIARRSIVNAKYDQLTRDVLDVLRKATENPP